LVGGSGVVWWRFPAPLLRNPQPAPPRPHAFPASSRVIADRLVCRGVPTRKKPGSTLSLVGASAAVYSDVRRPAIPQPLPRTFNSYKSGSTGMRPQLVTADQSTKANFKRHLAISTRSSRSRSAAKHFSPIASGNPRSVGSRLGWGPGNRESNLWGSRFSA